MAQFSTAKASFLWQALLILLQSPSWPRLDSFSSPDKISLNMRLSNARKQSPTRSSRVWSAITNADKEAFEHHAFQLIIPVSYCFLRDLCRHLLRSAGLQRTQSRTGCALATCTVREVGNDIPGTIQAFVIS